ncbi:MAG: tripartite tricarboxylate transporter substrate binding protein [Xanthobacteraceae bacterium]|nr:tripartite tricarboxylate transporter substrate binding protein [Xanthobacteraceae bacterium]
MSRLTFAIVCAVTVVTGNAPAHAQPYPSKPIRVIVPFAAGGAVDQLARIVAAKFQESVGQPVLVENRAGAGGTTGANDVAKAAPDGYTILQNTNGQAISPAIYKSLPFDAMRDFIPVTQLVATSTVLVANTRLRVRTAKDLIALAKERPGKLNYGMTGVGNSLHLTMEMFKRAAGIDIQAIPYRGDAPLNTALIAGEVDVAVVPLAAIVPHVQSGAIRALAVSSAGRSPLLPDVPTFGEDAVPGFEASGWQGWFVPAKTPAEIVAAIHRETAKIIADPAMAKRLSGMGNEPVGSTPEEFAAKFRDDVERFAKVVKEAGIPLQ